MRIDTSNNAITFGYHSPLKTLYKKGQMPKVIYGFYGDKLTPKNVTLEHLLPHSKGGASELDNFVLASKQNNLARGNADIRKFANKECIVRYLSQFMGIKLPHFNGDKYIKGILQTLEKLGAL